MIYVVDYNAGNTRSLMNRLKALNIKAQLSNDPEQLSTAEKIIFPGVGAAQSAMESLQRTELIDSLRNYKNPFLGICLGMQLMGSHSEEGDQLLLNLLDFEVREFKEVPKVPHMGWNSVYDLKGPLFKGLSENTDLYFVHSYYVELKSFKAATCNYGGGFSAALASENFFGCQFHPEKSGSAGSRILQNFNAL